MHFPESPQANWSAVQSSPLSPPVTSRFLVLVLVKILKLVCLLFQLLQYLVNIFCDTTWNMVHVLLQTVRLDHIGNKYDIKNVDNIGALG